MDKLDPQAVALAKAIRETESNNDFNASGASGEWGGYQFMPATWTQYSREAGVNAAFGSATPDQQNEVAYKKIKQWKDQGYNPGQIASMWNAGAGKPNAYIEGNKGVNSKGVSYDTKSYAEKVARAYQLNKAKVQLAAEAQKVPTEVPRETLSQKLAGRLSDASEGLTNPGLIRTPLRIGGAIAGGINDLIGAGLSAITPDFIEKPVTELVGGVVGGAVGGVMDTDLGQKAVGVYQGLDPEIKKDLGDIGNIASLVPVGKGVGLAKEAVEGAVPTVLKQVAKFEEKSVVPKYKGGLFEDARKYSTEEDFVRNQGDSLYRGGSELDQGKTTDSGISFSNSKNVAKDFATNKGGVVNEYKISPNARIVELNDVPVVDDYYKGIGSDNPLIHIPGESRDNLYKRMEGEYNKALLWAKENGYDGVKMNLEGETRLVNGNVVRSSKELSDIYRKSSEFSTTGSTVGGLLGSMAKKRLVADAVDIVAPKATAKVLKTAIKQGRAEKSGLLGGIDTSPDAKTIRAAEAAAGVVRKNKTLTENAGLVRDEIGTVAQKLTKDLSTMEIVPILQKEDIDDLLGKVVSEINDNPIMAGETAITAKADVILNKFRSFLPEGDVTAIDLLEARKKLDKWMEHQQAGNVFNPNYETAKSVALRAIRQGANDLVAAKAPDVNVKEALARQSALYDALDNISDKAIKEVGTKGYERLIRRHPYLTGIVKTGLTAAGAGGVAGLID